MQHDKKAIDFAIQKGINAFNSWSKTTPLERAQILHKIADTIDKQRNKLIELECLDTGRSHDFAKTVDIPRSIANFHFFADLLTQFDFSTVLKDAQGFTHKIDRSPLGVVSCISPWNLPLYLLTWKIAPALAAGNCVIAKPSELSPSSAGFLEEIFKEANLPAGVCSIIQGDGAIGSYIVENKNIKAVSFTGSTKTGALIAQSCAKDFKKVSLEMGGKNAALVFEDADLEKTAQIVARSAFTHQGQICLCTSRVLVQKNIYEEFKKALVKVVANWPKESRLISLEHKQKVQHFLDLAKKENGVFLRGNKWDLDNEQLYLYPTIIENLPHSSLVNQSEIFGPIITLTPFETVEQSITIANDTPYGLSACIFSNNQIKINKVAMELDVGMVWVNEWMKRDLRTPFGGVKQSGFGREGGIYALDFFTKLKTITQLF